jgi:hypothetical protein
VGSATIFEQRGVFGQASKERRSFLKKRTKKLLAL